MSWFDGIDSGSLIKIELNNNEILECIFIESKNGIISCKKNDGNLKRFKEDQLIMLEELQINDLSNDINNSTNILKTEDLTLSTIKNLCEQHLYIEALEYLADNSLPLKEKELNNLKNDIEKQMLAHNQILIEKAKNTLDEFFHKDIENYLFSYYGFKELNSMLSLSTTKNITNTKGRQYIEILNRIIMEKNINLSLIIGYFLTNRVGKTLRPELYNCFIKMNSLFTELELKQQEIYDFIIKSNKIIETNGLKIIKPLQYKYKIEDISTIKELNEKVSNLRKIKDLKELLILTDDLLKQKISFEFKVRLLEVRSQTFGSLNEESNAKEVYKELLKLLKEEDTNQDYKYENYLASYIGLNLNGEPYIVKKLMDELYKINPNSKAYQHYHKICISKGIIKEFIDEEQKKFSTYVNEIRIKKDYKEEEIIEEFNTAVQNEKYERIRISLYHLRKSKNKLSLKSKTTPILVYDINYFIIKHKEHPLVFANFLSEILSYNDKCYYEYYYLYPTNSNQIILNDIYFALKKNNLSLAYFAFEKLFSRTLLNDSIHYHWYLYLKYFDKTKTIKPIQYQIGKFGELTLENKLILFRSILHILNFYDIEYKTSEIDFNNFDLQDIEIYYNLLLDNVKIDASYERDVEQLKPIYGYLKNLEQFKSEFNYLGGFKYIEMINQILMGSNSDVLELKNQYEIYANKLNTLTEEIYLPRDDSSYRKGILSCYIEKDLEKTKEYLIESLKKDTQKSKEHALLEFIKIFKKIDSEFVIKIFSEYQNILTEDPNKFNIELLIIQVLIERDDYERSFAIVDSIIDRLNKLQNNEKVMESLLKFYTLIFSLHFDFNYQIDIVKLFNILDHAKILGLEEIEYRYFKALVFIEQNNLYEAKKELEFNKNKYHQKSIELLGSSLFEVNKISSIENPINYDVTKVKTILDSDLYKKFVTTFKKYLVDSSTYSLDFLKVATIEKEKFTIENLEQVATNIDKSQNFEHQSKYSMSAYKIALKLEENGLENPLIYNKEKYFIDSMVYAIRAYNFAKEYDKAILNSLFYLVYIGKHDQLMSVLNIFLHSVLKQQTHKIDKSIKQSSLNVIEQAKLDNIIKLLTAVGFNKECKKKLFKEFNVEQQDSFLQVLNTKLGYNHNDLHVAIDNFTKDIIDDINENIKLIKTINSYKYSEQSLALIINNFKTDHFIEIDKKNIKQFQKIIGEFANEINKFDSFSDKQNFIRLTISKLKDLQNSLKDAISLISFGLLYENTEISIQKIEAFEQEFLKESLPQFTITLPTNSEFTISNNKLCSEAKNILINIQDSNENKINNFYVPLIIGGQSISKEINFSKIEATTYTFSIMYDTLVSNGLSTSIDIDINLEDDEFEYIDNVYRVGQEVKDKSMFIGRDLLIKRLSEDIKKDRINSIILYGQKRAGKSSTFFHLKEKLLNEKYIPISFSMGKCDYKNFIKSIVNGIEEYYEETFEEDIFDDIGILRNEINDVVDLIRFLKKVKKQINKISGDLKDLILLLDEFTYVYGAIQDGSYPESFMQNWKAMLEENIFKALLIGQDSMPQFLQKYPNEFGVIEKVRITYLDIDAAKDLIINPIRMADGSSRYLDNSANMIIEHSACSPYFIQRICKEIVNILNQKKSNKITNLIVDNAIDEIISGHNGEKLEFFDNLYSLGSGEDELLKNERLQLLINIANKNYLDNSEITEKLLKELIDNDVIKKEKQSYSIKVKLFEKYLQVHYGSKNEQF